MLVIIKIKCSILPDTYTNQYYITQKTIIMLLFLNILYFLFLQKANIISLLFDNIENLYHGNLCKKITKCWFRISMKLGNIVLKLKYKHRNKDQPHAPIIIGMIIITNHDWSDQSISFNNNKTTNTKVWNILQMYFRCKMLPKTIKMTQRNTIVQKSRTARLWIIIWSVSYINAVFSAVYST